MWNRLILGMIVTLLLVSTVTATICQDTVTPGLPCTVVSPALSCVSYTYNIINASGKVIVANNLTVLNQSLYQFTFNQTAGDYVVRFCDNSTVTIMAAEDDNVSFLAVSLIYMFLAVLVVVGMLRTKYEWLKLFLSIPLSVLLVGLVRFASIFVTATNPTQTALINVLDSFYTIGIVVIYPLVVICIFVTIWLIVQGIRDAAKGKRSDEWGEWREEKHER